jgi:hypothetical protein
MTVLPFHNGALAFEHPKKGYVRYNPCGNPKLETLSGARPNPIRADYIKFGPSIVARLMVGLSVKGKNVYTVEFLRTLTRAYLRAHKMPENSTFVVQKGVYTHKRSKRVIEEDSSQIVLINEGVSNRKFFAVARSLAEHICKKMQQESVICEIQENGIPKHIYDIVA